VSDLGFERLSFDNWYVGNLGVSIVLIILAVFREVMKLCIRRHFLPPCLRANQFVGQDPIYNDISMHIVEVVPDVLIREVRICFVHYADGFFFLDKILRIVSSCFFLSFRIVVVELNVV